MTNIESSYTTRVSSDIPYAQRLEVTREDQYPSGLIAAISLASMTYVLDLSKVTVPEGLVLPDLNEIRAISYSRIDESEHNTPESYSSLSQLRRPLAKFVASAFVEGSEFTLHWTDHASDAEEQLFREVSKPHVPDVHPGGMYL